MREIDERCKKCINYHPHPWCRIFGKTIRWTEVNECRDCEFILEQDGILKTHNNRADQFKEMKPIGG